MTKSNPASPDDEGHCEPITEVAVAVIHHTRGPGPTEGALLATLRAPEGLRGDLWELPGGKIDPGETPQVAVCRELREELELEFVPTQGRLFGTAGDHDPSQPRERTVRLHGVAFEVGDRRLEPRLQVARDLAWIDFDTFEAYAWPPATRRLLATFLNWRTARGG